MNIISFDVGMKNMAYVIGSNDQIFYFDKLNLQQKTFLKTLNYLNFRLNLLDWKTFRACLIEAQHPRNVKALRLMQHLWTWIRCKYPFVQVFIVPPDSSEKGSYRRRKTQAILKSEHYFKGPLGDKFKQLSKRDDVADAAVQFSKWSLIQAKLNKKSNP